MGTENVQIVATARDQASPVINKLKANVTSLGSKGRGPLGGLLTGLGAISPVALGAVAGITALSGALVAGVAGALEEDKQIARLSATLKANVKDWDGSTEAVDRATQAAMDLAFSDDDARESMIRLITATGSVTASVKDMHLAMEIARGRNIDLASATDIVIKANMGNVGALRRLGIEIKKGSSATEILAELQQRYAGQAESYASTTAGKFESAQKKVNDALENTGHLLVNIAGALLSLADAHPQGLMNLTGPDGKPLPLRALGTSAVSQALSPLENMGAMSSLIASEARDRIAAATTEGVVSGVKDGLEGAVSSGRNDVRQAMDALGGQLTDNLADSLRGTGNVVNQAIRDITWALNHPKALERKLGRIQGVLGSQNLQSLLSSSNPMQRAIGLQVQARLTGQVNTLTGTTYTQGVVSIVGAINSLKAYLSGRYLGPVMDRYLGQQLSTNPTSQIPRG